MRIIAGTLRGRRLLTPGSGKHNPVIRPTADRAREALFSIIGRRIDGAGVVDLFAGTGAFGLEALSRGALSVLFVDNQVGALTLIHNNVEQCGFSDRSLVVKRDLTKGLSFLDKLAPAQGFSLVFLDPPYGQGLALDCLHEIAAGVRLSKDNALVIAEESAKETLPDTVGSLSLNDKRHYGDTGFWFYERKELASR